MGIVMCGNRNHEESWVDDWERDYQAKKAIRGGGAVEEAERKREEWLRMPDWLELEPLASAAYMAYCIQVGIRPNEWENLSNAEKHGWRYAVKTVVACTRSRFEEEAGARARREAVMAVTEALMDSAEKEG